MVLLWLIQVGVVVGLVRFQAVTGRAAFSITLWTALLAALYLLGSGPFWLLLIEAVAGVFFFGLLQLFQHDWRWYPTLFFGAPFVVIL